jgi:hypothetical protein
VSDYLSQLALRVQQPEFAVQPRPVSRFESQRHSIPMAPEPSAPEEADEQGPQSAVFIPAETNVDRVTQPTDSRTRREPDILDSLSEVQSTKKYNNLHPGQSTGAPAIVTPVNSTETTDSPVPHPASRRQPAEQSERIIRSAVAQAQPSARVDKRASAAIVTSASSTETTDSPVLEVPHPASRRQPAEQSERIIRSAVAQAQPTARIDRLEQQTSKASSDPSGRRERSELTDLVARRESEWRGSLVRSENPKGERSSSPSTRALNHREIGMFSESTETEPLFGRKTEVTTKSGLAPVPRRENPQLLGEPADPQFGMARATDAPTIQVTIGRVEIRATVASTPTRKTPTHTPAMSLDEYLKQRNGSRG